MCLCDFSTIYKMKCVEFYMYISMLLYAHGMIFYMYISMLCAHGMIFYIYISMLCAHGMILSLDFSTVEQKWKNTWKLLVCCHQLIRAVIITSPSLSVCSTSIYTYNVIMFTFSLYPHILLN